MKYPLSIEFIGREGKLNVSYNKTSKYNLDIWAISYLLNENKFMSGGTNVVQLDLRDLTMSLRSYFLPKIIKNLEFSPDVTARATKIIDEIKSGRYITYENDYSFKRRGTKVTKESKLEKNIFENLSKYFKEEFNSDEKGIRQFPANMFDGSVSEKNRISRKFWIDILTVNRDNQLSVLELKAGGNAPLDLFIQAIDYGIFCYLFKDHIASYPFINNKQIINKKVAVYMIAENFHPAIIGGKNHKGIIPLIQKNEFLDVILMEIKEKNGRIEVAQRYPLDTRQLCNL